jgi:hypothetical protein
MALLNNCQFTPYVATASKVLAQPLVENGELFNKSTLDRYSVILRPPNSRRACRGRGIALAQDALLKNDSPALEYVVGENHMLMTVRKRP